MKNYLKQAKQASLISLVFYLFVALGYILCIVNLANLTSYFINTKQLSFEHIMILIIAFAAIHTTVGTAIIFFKFAKNEKES